MFRVETERLVLTPFTMDDQEEYFPIISENEIKKYVPYASSYSMESTRELLETYCECDFKRDFYICIRNKETNEIIGTIIAVDMSRNLLDICYFIKKSCRKKGYCTEALLGFIKYLTNMCYIYRLSLTIENENLASQNVAKSCGAKIRRVLSKSTIYWIKIEDPLELL